MRLRHAVVGSALVSALMFSSCGGTHENPNPTEPTRSVDSDQDGIADLADVCPNSAETFNKVWDTDGCPDTPVDLYRAVRTDVETYWQNYFASRYIPIARLQLFVGQTGGYCGTVNGPSYCPLDYTVYLEQFFMDRQLQQFGDFAPAIIIAHEIGHHIQTILGVNKIFSISRELDADCLAGAWAANAGARGLLEVGDIQEAAGSLFSVGDRSGTAWFAADAHGTPFQRIVAFNRGYRNGPAGCNF
jgi:predicted metalloprotease